MKLLSIDTSFQDASIALITNGVLKDFLRTERHNEQVERINGMLLDILKRNHTEYGDINYIAVNTGPGRFSGIRIGVSLVNALLLIKKNKVIPASTFEIMAFLFKERSFYAVLPAGIEKYYYAICSLGKVSQMGVMAKEQILALKKNMQIIGNVDFADQKLNVDAKCVAAYAEFKLKHQRCDFEKDYVKPLYLNLN